MKRALPLIAIFFLLATPVWAQTATGDDATTSEEEEEGVGPSITPFLRDVLASGQPLTLEADQVEFDQEKQTYHATGNVVLRQQEVTLTADQMVLDLRDELLVCDGEIILTTPQGSVRAQSVVIDLKAETAVMARALFVVVNEDVTYYVRGKQIEKIGPERYLIHHGSYTTCDCGAAEADWLVEAEYIDVTFDGYAIVERGRIYLQGLPVAYVPYGVFPAKVKRSTGFLWPSTGWANDDGYHVGVPFYWNIAPHTDATLDTDWYENRGTKLGLQHRFAISRNWEGEANVDYIDDRLEDEQRWAISYEYYQNPYRRLYIRSKINMVSDNQYVVDFPSDISARYDRYLRNDFIVNNLWQDYDLNVLFRHWDNLSVDDNSHTWQQYPQATFNALSSRIASLPLYWTLDAQATNFYRPKISADERALDTLAGHEHPYFFLTDGQRATLQPGLHAPLNFNQVVTFTPYAIGEGSFYQLGDRDTQRSLTRATAEMGADAYTRFERVFPVRAPIVRGLKHQLEPAIGYRYRPEVDQDELPIFDGFDRLGELSELNYGLTNRLWMRLFDAPAKRFHTLKLTDFRVLHGYDFAEADRELDPLLPDDERRPWQPWTFELETLATAGRWLNKIIMRSELDYDTYQDDVTRFNVLGALGTVNDDALGAEYRYHLDRNDVIDIEYLSGIFRYTLQDFITFEAIDRYSFLDRYFVEQIYALELHSIQNCWNIRLQLEQHEIPEPETVTILLFDLTGLVQASTSF